MKVLWYLEEVVCNGDDPILNPLFDFEPMKRLEHWGDVRIFGVRVTAREVNFEYVKGA